MRVRPWLTLVLTICLISVTGLAAAEASVMGFTDTEGLWGDEAISQAQALGLVKGKQPAIFAPKDNVTRQEMIVMLLRALGKDDEASNLDLGTLNLEFPDSAEDWARKHIALAVQEGLIQKSKLPNINFKGPASRLEAAVLIAMALDLPQGDAELPFGDINQIDSYYIPYVKEVVNNNIMKGRSGDVFAPQENISRMEMATLLCRLVDSGYVNPAPGRYFIGKVLLVNSADNSITLQTTGGTSTYHLSPQCMVYVDGQRLQLGSLSVGSNVKVVLDGSGRCSFLAETNAGVWTPSAGTGQEGGTAGSRNTGYVVNKFINSFTVRYNDGTTEELDVLQITKFEEDGFPRQYWNLKPGYKVRLQRLGNMLTGVQILDNTPRFFGEVLDINSREIEIKDADGYERDYDLASDCTIKDREGYRVDREDIDEHDEVELVLNGDGEVVTIVVTPRETVEGRVAYVNAGDREIIIIDEFGQVRPFKVLPGAAIRDEDADDDEDLDLDDIDTGFEVVLVVNDENEVIRIEVDDRSILSGKVTELDLTSDEITIEDEDDNDETYDLAEKVVVYDEDGDETYLGDLNVGDEVTLTLDLNDSVTRIQITARRLLEGIVTNIDDRDNEIRIDPEEGRHQWYDVDRDAEIVRDGEDIDLDEILVGAEVEFRLSGGDIIYLEVVDDEDITVRGKITNVDENDREITIKQVSGERFTFEFEDRADLEDEDGKDIEIDDLRDGWEVELELDDGLIEDLRVLER